MKDSKSKIGHNNKKLLLNKPVEHIDITSFDSRKIIDSMSKMSFASRDTAKAAEIYNEMLQEKKLYYFFNISWINFSSRMHANLLRFN